MEITNIEENCTMNDLKQKLINYLYNLRGYDEMDVEIMKILFYSQIGKDETVLGTLAKEVKKAKKEQGKVLIQI